MALAARDLMERHVISVSPDDPLSSVQRLFSDEEIHGAPVVDEQGSLLGVISSIDLLRAAAELGAGGRGAPGGLAEFDWGSLPEDFGERLGEQVVSDVMSPQVVSVDAAAPIAEVARTMREHLVHRVVVTEEGRACGILSAFDLIAVLETAERP